MNQILLQSDGVLKAHKIIFIDPSFVIRLMAILHAEVIAFVIVFAQLVWFEVFRKFFLGNSLVEGGQLVQSQARKMELQFY